MREISSVFEKGFLSGLRISPSLRTTVEYLSCCYNLVPSPYGLEPRQDVVNPISDVSADEWPFPCLFVLSRYILLFTKTGLFKVEDDWSLTFLLSADWGGRPQIADFMTFVVWSTPNGQWCLRDGAIVAELGGASFRSCCAYRGQLIVGDLTLPNGPGRTSSGNIENITPVSGPSLVAWSKIGSLEWEFNFGNEVGWAPMSWIGSVLAILPLGKELVVYGENGIAKMAPADSPAVTFGIADFGDIGLLNRNCVAGDGIAHVFIGTDKALYKVEPEKALSGEGKIPTRLGYEEFIKLLDSPIVSFDTALRHWWVGDKNNCFILTDSGMGESGVTPTNLGRLDGTLLGITFTNGADCAIVETSPLSFSSRGIKTLMCVEADLESSNRVHGYTRWRGDFRKEFQRTKNIHLDPRGAFFPIIAGTEFIVGLCSEDFHTLKVSKLWLHYKNTDKHFSRGVINAGRPAE